KDEADKIIEKIKDGEYKISDINKKEVNKKPPVPLITSTLQQEASRKLGFGAKRTMQAAQKLYEEGRITYMRTDGVNMAEEAYVAARAMIQTNYGARYLPENTRRYSSKAKNAQEAHEAVRPTDFNLRPEEYHGEGDLKKLYTLVWRRAVASQMETALFERTTIDLASKDKRAALRATGQVLVFDGYIKLYTEGHDAGEDDDDAEGRLPKMAEGQHADLMKANANQSFTAPPPRYTEASLVKRLEELGIGRPSTYASTMSTLEDRGYVRIEGKALVPEDKGRLVTAFLENFFSRYVEYDFTAGLEEKLDVISDGKLDWKVFLHEFWKQFAADIDGTKDLRVSAVLDALNETLGAHVFPRQDADGNPIENPRLCPLCKEGELSMKLGKFGAFVGCSRHPECKYTRQFSSEGGAGAGINPDGNEIGIHPEKGEMILLKSGRFGPYVEMANGEKPKRASLAKADSPDTLTLSRAVELLSLPREIGPHPEDGEMIVANFGRFGPYVQHGKTYANLKDPTEVFSIGINRAVDLIAEKRAKAAAGGGRGGVAALKSLGDHPDGGPVEVFAGKYGPYVKWGKVNATLPKDMAPETVTLEAALELVNAKAGASGGKKKAAPKKATPKKPAAKKPAAKKAPAKKKSADE
ncbi:MAG: topoisomerase DNA-binding C4 zinc finger domain-containing protein, partial [Alphaproteobacteria bacterium]|nr:topoisomerase DNA-binding C4 zinc finger domain-containing protein [Alphaproteobacteria bacterium]